MNILNLNICDEVLLANEQEIFGDYSTTKEGWTDAISLNVGSGDVQYILKKALLRGFELGKEYACSTKEVPVQ